MSALSGLSGAGIGLLGSAAASLIQSIFIRPRNIAGFVANVTLEEHHHDTLTITRHPVAQGSTITDHAFKEPAVVIVRCGWTNSGGLNTLFDPNYVRRIYQQFLTLQSGRVPFSIVTGKRTYQNMLVHRLMTATNQDTEESLILTVECQELIMATTSVVVTPSSASMASPQINGATQQQGTVTPTAGGYNFNATQPAL
jgi:hypothetical protein